LSKLKLDQVPVKRQDQEEDVLGDADACAGRADRDRDPAGAGRVQVDVVVADPLVLDQAKVRCLGQQIGGDRRRRDEEKLGRGDGR